MNCIPKKFGDSSCSRGQPLVIFINVIWNHAESWLDSLIPDLIPC